MKTNVLIKATVNIIVVSGPPPSSNFAPSSFWSLLHHIMSSSHYCHMIDNLKLFFCLLALTTYCLSRRKTIIPWTIAAVNPPSNTFRSFFAAQVQPQRVDSTFSQAGLDPDDVIHVFDPYLKYSINRQTTVVE